MKGPRLTGVGHFVWNMPFEIRILALLVFLGVVSGIELAIRGGNAVRWLGSILIATLGVGAAIFGCAIDLITSWISPAYFAIGKGLGWEEGLVWRACVLGLQAGATAGVLIGCVFSYVNYRPGLRSLALTWVLKQAWYPMGGAVLFGVALGSLPEFLAQDRFPDAVIAWVPAKADAGFLVVWCAHTGVYLGAVVGVVVAAIRIRRAQRKALG